MVNFALLIPLIPISCEREDNLPIENTTNGIIINSHKLSALKKDNDFNTSFDLVQLKIAQLEKSKTAKGTDENDVYDFYIDEERINEVIIGNKKSYTLFIYRDTPTDYFENLVIQRDSIGETTSMIIRYHPTKLEETDIHNSFLFEGGKGYFPIIMDNINLFGKGTTCSVVSETWCSYAWDHLANNSCFEGNNLFTVSTTLCVDDPADAGSPYNNPTPPGGGGGDTTPADNSGSNDGAITSPIPPDDLCLNGKVKNEYGVCECPDGKIEDSNGNCVCEEGKVESANGNCYCPDGKVEDNNGNCIDRDLCAEIKEQFLDSIFKIKLEELKLNYKDSIETGYLQKADSIWTKLTPTNGGHSLTIPVSYSSNTQGYMHVHTDKYLKDVNGDLILDTIKPIRMHSPKDISQLLKIAYYLKLSNVPYAVSDAYGIMTSSTGTYNVKFTGKTVDINANQNKLWGLTKEENDSLNELYRNYIKKYKKEKGLLKYIDNVIGIDGIRLFKIEENGTIFEKKLKEDGTLESKPCIN